MAKKSNKASLSNFTLEKINLQALHITFNDQNILKIFQQELKLTGKPGKQTTFGAGKAKYAGESWSDGAIFIGQNDQKGYLVLFKGDVGFEQVEKITESQKIAAHAGDLKLTQCQFVLPLAPPKPANNAAFLNDTFALMQQVEKSKINVSSQRGTVVIGKRTSKLMVIIAPEFEVVNDEKVMTVFGLDVRLGSGSCQSLLSMLLSKTNTLQNYLASLVFANLNDFSKTAPLVSHIRAEIQRLFSISNVVIMKAFSSGKTKTSTFSKQVRPVFSSISTILNKLRDASLQRETKQILLEQFFPTLVSEKDSIEDYEAFINNILAILKK